MIVSLSKASQLVKRYLSVGIVPFILGSPAIGKSAIVHDIADSARLKLIDVRLAERDPTDISGFGYVENGRSNYAPQLTFPIESDPIPEGYNGWLLFLDELPNAPAAVQNVAYRLILDKMVGNHKLHPNVYIVAAGNKDTDGCHTETLSNALISRMAVFEVHPDPKEWCEYAASVEADHRIIGFISWRNDYLYTFNPEREDRAYASPRTWMFVDRLTNEQEIQDSDVTLLAPLLSEAVAREFIAFTQIYRSLTKVSEIIANPTGVKIPDRIDIKWATLTSVAAAATESNIEQLSKYINRFPGEYRVVCMRQIAKRHPELMDTEVMAKWFEENAEELI